MNARGPSFGTIQQSPNLTGGLIETLVAQISSGQLAPGQRLPTEQAIVNATGVSRTVVREALASLRARGLITTRQGLGAFVAENPISKSMEIGAQDLDSITDVLHVLELRMSIEVEAAGLSAQRRTPEDLTRLQDSFSALSTAIGTAGSGAEEDFAFHRAILASTQNPYFTRFFDVFGSLIIPRQRLRLSAMSGAERQRYLQRIQREHEVMLIAIRDGDAVTARRAARTHLAKSHARYKLLRDQANPED